MRTKNPIRIALLHYADVRNYGDVLFPYLAARELGSRLPASQIDFISATGNGPQPALRYDAAVMEDYDAVVLAGGELIHRHDAILNNIYAKFGLQAIENPTDLVFGWSHVRGPYKAWFGLGVPRLNDRSRDAIARSAPGLDFILLRGSGSARRLAEAGGTGAVGPDIGWLFSQLLPGTAPPKQSPYMIVQALPPAVPDDLDIIIKPLKKLERHGLQVVLLPLSTCWSDETVLGRIAERSGFRLIDYRVPEIDKLQILADSAMYIGQSQHGFISALAAGRPAGLCFPAGDDKFGELLGDLGLEDLHVKTWHELPVLIDRLMKLSPERVEHVRAHTIRQVTGAFDTLAGNIERHVRARAH